MHAFSNRFFAVLAVVTCLRPVVCEGGDNTALTHAAATATESVVSSSNVVRKPKESLHLTGKVSTLAGTGGVEDGNTQEASARFDDGQGSAETAFTSVHGITTDGTNLYVTDPGSCRISKIVVATGEVIAVAGTKVQGFADGPGLAAAKFSQPEGITTDGKSLYVVDSGNDRIRKIDIASGEVSTLAGRNGDGEKGESPRGFADGDRLTARFFGPHGITTDGTNLFVTDPGNNRIRKIAIKTGLVSTVAGSGQKSKYGDILRGAVDGSPETALFDSPTGITTDGAHLYVTDTNNNRIRKIVIATGEVSTFAGSGGIGIADGSPKAAQFDHPYGIATDGTNLYVADSGNHCIRKIVIATGMVSTVAGIVCNKDDEWAIGGFADGAGNKAKFNLPFDVTTDGKYLYVTDTLNQKIRRIE